MGDDRHTAFDSLLRASQTLMLGLALLIAGFAPSCATPPNEERHSSNPSPRSETKRKAAANSVVSSTEDIAIVGSEFTIDRDGHLEYCMDCDRQSATYHYCVFDAHNVESTLGSHYRDVEATLVVAMTQRNVDTYVPEDSNAPQPEGGFSRIYFSCTIEGPPDR